MNVIVVLLVIIIIQLYIISSKLPDRDYVKEAVDSALERDKQRRADHQDNNQTLS